MDDRPAPGAGRRPGGHGRLAAERAERSSLDGGGAARRSPSAGPRGRPGPQETGAARPGHGSGDGAGPGRAGPAPGIYRGTARNGCRSGGWLGLVRRGGDRATGGRRAGGLRRRHGGLVPDLPGKQKAGDQYRCGFGRLRDPRRGPHAGRLDPSERRDFRLSGEIRALRHSLQRDLRAGRPRGRAAARVVDRQVGPFGHGQGRRRIGRAVTPDFGVGVGRNG